MPPRILLADDHPHVLANLSRLADEVGEVVGTVQDGRTVIQEVLRLQPDIVILDLRMPGINGLVAARELRQVAPGSRIIVCTVQTHAKVIEEAFANGVSGYVRKQSAHEDLAPAIRAALAGEQFISPAIQERNNNRKNRVT